MRVFPALAHTQAAWLEHHGTRDASLDDLERSLMATGANWNAFLSEAEGAGWNLGDILIR